MFLKQIIYIRCYIVDTFSHLTPRKMDTLTIDPRKIDKFEV